jgi:hypothetical protein
METDPCRYTKSFCVFKDFQSDPPSSQLNLSIKGGFGNTLTVAFLSNKKYFGLPIDKTYRLDQ